jgi:tetratricopeptide (TPR) repeat protein
MLLAAHSGIERIRRMQRMLGPRAGFVGGLVQTAVARRSTDPPRRGPPTKRALQMFAHTLIMAGSLALAQTERQRLLELRQLMEPLAKIKTGNLDRVFRFLTMMEGVSFGRFGEVRDTAVALLAEAEGRRSKTWATDFELRVFEGAVRFVYGLALARSDRYRALENIEALEALGIKLWELGAQQLRRTYHLRRGETDAAKEILSRLELSYAELGSVWQLELGLGPGTALARALIGDVMGLRRSIDQLERLVERGIDYTGALDLARADYHRERGEYDVALECVDRALIGYQNGGFGRGWGLTCRAQILLEASALGRADKAIREGSDYVCDPVHRDDGVYFRFVRVEALLRAAQGEPESAATQLDAALLEAAPTENPAYLGLLHESRALVARTGGDLKGFHKHRRTAEAWFRSTDNPVLVARIERLHPTTGSYRAVGGAPDEVPATVVSTSVRDILAEPDSYTERLERALRLLVESTGAIGGYLFLVHGSRLELVVPHVGAEPPDGLVDVLRSATSRGLGWQALYRGDAGTFRALVLRIDPSLDTPAVAVAALQAGQEPLHPPEAEMVSDVAEVVSFAPPRDREPSASDSSSTSAAASDNRNDPKTIVD